MQVSKHMRRGEGMMEREEEGGARKHPFNKTPTHKAHNIINSEHNIDKKSSYQADEQVSF